MENKYKVVGTVVSLINYHFIFCPRYRRKIFNIPGVEERFRKLINAECERCGIEILSLECYEDYVHLFVEAPPDMSTSDIMKQIKKSTSLPLKQEFSQLGAMSSIWTRSYLVSTADNMSSEDIREYVHAQKTRP